MCGAVSVVLCCGLAGYQCCPWCGRCLKEQKSQWLIDDDALDVRPAGVVPVLSGMCGWADYLTTPRMVVR